MVLWNLRERMPPMPESGITREQRDDSRADALITALRQQLVHDARGPSGLVARLQAHSVRAGAEHANTAIGTRVVLGALLFSTVAITQPGAPLVAGVLVAALFAWRIDFGAADEIGRKESLME